MFCVTAQHCMMYHTMPKQINHSSAASQERTLSKPTAVPGLPAGLPGLPADILVRAMGITRVEDLPDCDHTVW